MKIFKVSFFILFALFVFTGCFFGDEGAESNITGHYFTRGDSDQVNVIIMFEDEEYGAIGLLDKYITAVGHNSDYIIAKCDLDKTYYILKVVDSGDYSDAEKAVVGPLSEDEFNKSLRQFGISESIKFEQYFDIK